MIVSSVPLTRCANLAVAAALFACLSATPAARAAQPAISSVAEANGSLIISATLPAGYRHALLEAGNTVHEPLSEPLVSGPLNASPAMVTFHVPSPGGLKFFRVRVGPEETVPAATYSGPSYFSVEYTGGPLALSAEEQIGHVLTRLTYGPSPQDVQTVETMGVHAFVAQQLDPAGIDESSNTALSTREAALFYSYQPAEDNELIRSGDQWHYFKGTQAPPVSWAALAFDDSTWLQGPSGFGYGDGDDATQLTDMRQTTTQPGYTTVFLRKSFSISNPAEIERLILEIDYDDGFVAYVNGVEIRRVNASGAITSLSTASSDHEAGSPEEFDITSAKSLLRTGENVLALVLLNVNATSSDATLIPVLLTRKALPLPSQQRIRGIEELQHLVHVRGIYSKRQLQAILAEFWENHFTTDHDKVAEYFEDLRNSDARPAMSESQAITEAAHAEYLEYQFFYENAFGNFGDLLLYSATSPTQLIYLDNVLNVKGAANENYAREILELFAFGVDNRYTQRDIEELARCFTGWGVRKIWPDQAQPFPASARTPPTESNVQFDDTVLLNTGPGWKYVKGTAEPAPDATGAPTTAWTEINFDDSTWLNGATGIGYGDGDDATVLSDMRNNFLSVYLRREFMVTDPTALKNFLLAVNYDDGFVAYLNGTEVARTRTMRETGTPPPYNRPATGNHEAGSVEVFSLASYMHLLKPAPQVNVLAIQAHNVDLTSSDFSIIPRLIERALTPGSIENGNPNGLWTFRFNPDQHDTGPKTLFAGTPYQINVPSGRTGIDGLRDAVDLIDGFVSHPSVSEFICLKLVNKFVSDEISLESYHQRTASPELLATMDDAIAAWHSTVPAGNIRTVMEAILTPASQQGHFWSREAYRSKIRTAVEFINGTVRALGANVNGASLPTYNDQLGMHLFTRDDPDGWSEIGSDWMDTGALLARIKFAQSLSLNRISNVTWDLNAWRNANGLASAESIIDYFDDLLFQGKLAPSNRDLLITFATTNDNGDPLPLDPARTDYQGRVRELVSLILSMPQCHYQ